MEHVTERSARKQHKENPWQHQMLVTLRFFFIVPKCTAGQTFHHVLLPGALERSSEMLSPLAIGGLLASVTGALWWTVLGHLAAHCSMRFPEATLICWSTIANQSSIPPWISGGE
jgi:hypothetical protein